MPDVAPYVGFLFRCYSTPMCIAAQFALADIIVVVARLLAEMELAAAGAQPQVTLQVTTRSGTGLNVVAQRRS